MTRETWTLDELAALREEVLRVGATAAEEAEKIELEPFTPPVKRPRPVSTAACSRESPTAVSSTGGLRINAGSAAARQPRRLARFVANTSLLALLIGPIAAALSWDLWRRSDARHDSSPRPSSAPDAASAPTIPAPPSATAPASLPRSALPAPSTESKQSARAPEGRSAPSSSNATVPIPAPPAAKALPAVPLWHTFLATSSAGRAVLRYERQGKQERAVDWLINHALTARPARKELMSVLAGLGEPSRAALRARLARAGHPARIDDGVRGSDQIALAIHEALALHLVQLSDLDAAARNRKAWAAFLDGKGTGARAEIDGALAIAPAIAAYLDTRGQINLLASRCRDAVIDFDDAIEGGLRHPLTYQGRATCHERGGNRAAAIADYRQTVELAIEATSFSARETELIRLARVRATARIEQLTAAPGKR